MSTANKTSFATIRITGDFVSIAQNSDNDPRSPAVALNAWEIKQYVPEFEDGRLWGVWEIPMFMDDPKDLSNFDSIRLELSDEFENREVVQHDNALYIKIFDENSMFINLEKFDL